MSMNTKNGYGSQIQYSKQWLAETTAGATQATGFPTSTPIIAPHKSTAPIRVFKVQGCIAELTGTNPLLQLMDKSGNVFFERHGVVGEFSQDWDYPGARAISAYDGTNNEVPLVAGPIYLHIKGDTKVDLFLKVEAYEVSIGTS